MNNQKFELTQSTITHFGRTLYQIRALRDIVELSIKAGDLGGWIEKIENLSQSGNCWVFGNGRVYDNGMVCDNGMVYGDARVCDNAWVMKQYDLLIVSNLGSRDDATSFFRVKDGGIFVRCGCFAGSIDDFEARVKQVHGDNQHGRAYEAAISMARAVVSAEAVEDPDDL